MRGTVHVARRSRAAARRAQSAALSSSAASIGDASDAWHDPEFARTWDASDVLVTNPNRTEHLALLSELLTARIAASGGSGSVVELGCGSGHIAELVVERVVGVETYAGFDFSQAMLELAKARLAPHIVSGQCAFYRADFRDLAVHPAAVALASSPPSAVLAVQTLHEVPSAIKRDVYAVAKQLLEPSRGCFYVLDRFGPHGYSPQGRATLAGLEPEFRAMWTRSTRAAAREDPALRHKTWEEYLAYLDKDDHIEDVEETMAGLRDAGFASVHCVHKAFNRAIICAA